MTEPVSPYPEDNAYLRELGIQPRLRRGLNLLGQGFFGIAFQGPTAGTILGRLQVGDERDWLAGN